MAQVRAPMPASRRAKQFSMFDALKGFKEALAAQERQPEPRRELAQDAIEELNYIIKKLHIGDIVTVAYYCNYRREYCQRTGILTRNDNYWKFLQIGALCVDYSDILNIYI